METSAPTATDLSAKTALVTGASRGIGRACAEALARAGARVITVARSPQALQSLAQRWPGAVEPWVYDVRDPAFYRRIEQQRQLHILINNAGINKPQPFSEVSGENLELLLELNVKAAFRCAQAAVRVMLREKIRGCIINMSSQMGHVGSPGRSAYCLTKHAIEGLTKALAVELAPQGIRANSIAPTFVLTDLTGPMFADPQFNDFVMQRIPMQQLATPEQIAAAAVFLASPAAAMITGDCLKVDGGWTAQ